MPHIVRLADTFETLVFEAGPPRTPGLHVSDIIQSMLRDIDAKKYSNDGNSETRQLYFQTGFAFERVMEQAFNARRLNIFRPGELAMDGVLLSPDGVNLDEGADDEIKWTTRSSRDALMGSKWNGWHMQFMAYCRALGTRTAIVRALFAMGDWKTKQPEFGTYRVTYTNQEIETNWRALMKHAEQKGMR